MNEQKVIDEKKATPELRDYAQKRIKLLQEAMTKKGIDLAIISSPENVFYFSNFNPVIISHAPYFVVCPKKSFLLVHAIRYNHAMNEGATEDVFCYGKWGKAKSVANSAMEAIKLLAPQDTRSIAIEGEYASFNFIEDLKLNFGVEKFFDISRMISHQRLVKDPYEIKMCRISGKLVDIGVSRAIEALKDGYSEAAACTEGQYAMRQEWHKNYQNYEVSGFSNNQTAQIDTLCVWCMTNERLNYGCDCPTGYVPQNGDVTMPMSWARVSGYNVENERSIMVGKVSDTRKKAYDAMLRARKKIFEHLKPGTIFSELYLMAMEEFIKAGFEDILPGRCGHGMGLSSHEFPSVAKENDTPLAAGMIITVEPGLMSQEIGAVRHSDTVLITEEGFEFLTNTPREVIAFTR